MLSTVPTIFSSNSNFENDPFPAFESGLTPWEDCFELFPAATQSIGSVISGSGSDESTQNQINSNSGLEDELEKPDSITDERKTRRMIWERPRRSRMRKRKHLEDLRNQVNRLKVENRELTNHLRFILYHCHLVKTDNNRFQTEHSMLRQKLWNIRQVLLAKQVLQPFSSAWPCNNVTVMSEQTPSLMT